MCELFTVKRWLIKGKARGLNSERSPVLLHFLNLLQKSLDPDNVSLMVLKFPKHLTWSHLSCDPPPPSIHACRSKHYDRDDIFIIVILQAVALTFVFSVSAWHFNLSGMIKASRSAKGRRKEKQVGQRQRERVGGWLTFQPSVQADGVRFHLFARHHRGQSQDLWPLSASLQLEKQTPGVRHRRVEPAVIRGFSVANKLRDWEGSQPRKTS